MVLRKPYAFFIKIFKPLHLLIAIMLGVLIKNEYNILVFFSQYIYNSGVLIGMKIVNEYVNAWYYAIPIIGIALSSLLIFIMLRKGKPVLYYFVSIILFFAVILLNIYNANFMKNVEAGAVAIKSMKLARDFSLINIIILTVIFLGFLIRGLGLNIKKFEFESDLAQLSINESDNEEVEVSLSLDIDSQRRMKNQKIRYLKYAYMENKFIVNLVLCVLIVLVFLGAFLLFKNRDKKYYEGKEYTINNFNIVVNSSSYLQNGLSGKKLTDNYLLIVDFSLKTKYLGTTLFSNDLSLNIGKSKYKPIDTYLNELADIGTTYNGEYLTGDYVRYILVYEIPAGYINDNMYFTYSNVEKSYEILLDPKEYNSNSNEVLKNITESISFENTLGDINFQIDGVSINQFFINNYQFCITDDDCIPSKEYIRPTASENFDKTIIKLENVKYNNNSNISANSFYNFFIKYGKLEYLIDDNWVVQSSGFELLTGEKVDDGDNVYIGVNKQVEQASSVKLTFNIRNSIYEYVLR